jgi:thiol-disulfide isomerase/thioredoxin
MTEIKTKSGHASFIAKNHKAVIFFGKIGCSHCDDMKPVVRELMQQNPDVAFAHIEVSKVETSVEGVPVFVAYRDGVAKGMITGSNAAGLRRMVSEL